MATEGASRHALRRGFVANVAAVTLLATACSDHDPLLIEHDTFPGDATGPAGVGAGVRVYQGDAWMLSSSRSCTEGDTTSDRWCIFVGVSQTSSNHNLFVVNVSAAMAGVSVDCNAPDANCLLLTDHLTGTSGNGHPAFFSGDTLVYYDQDLAAYVWWPGLEGGRLLASREGVRDIAYCTPASRGSSVACLGIPFEQPDNSMIVGEIYAGAANGVREPLLGPVDSVIVATLEDTVSVHRFGFAPLLDGYVAWSSREMFEGPEVLNLVNVDDPTRVVTVATAAHKWGVTDDGTRWLWIRTTNELGIGTLEVAGFPDGSNPTSLVGETIEFRANRSGSVVALTRDYAAVAVVDTLGRPGEQVPIDSEVDRIAGISDQGHIVYSKAATRGLSDLLVASVDGRRSCAIETTSSATSPEFAPGAPLLMWSRAEGDVYDAFLSRLTDCENALLAKNVAMAGFLGDGHAVFVDEFDARTSTGSLRFRKVDQRGVLHPAPPTLIAEHVDTTTTSGPDYMVYAVRAGTEADGAYVRAFGR